MQTNPFAGVGRAVVKVLSLTTAVAVLAGCAGSTPGTDAPAEQSINEEAKLRVGVKFFPASWDPAKSPAPADLSVLRLVYDGLLDVDADRGLAPALAESWETNDGGITWDFKLREDAVFTSGDTFDAADAKATLEYYKSEQSSLRTELALVDTVEVVDDYTLRVVNSSPVVGTPGIFTGRSGLMMSADDIGGGDITAPSGTGRFELKQEQTGVSMEFVANDTFWNPDLIQVAGVTVRAIEDPIAMANSIRSGEIELGIIDPTQVEAVSADGFGTYEFPSQLVALGLNSNLAPELADQRVRDALTISIDRDGIVSGLLFGHGEPANQFFIEGMSGFDPSLSPYVYDIDKAKQLLTEAGLGDGFSFTIAVQAANRQLMEAIQASWAEIGVDVELTFPAGSGVTEAAWGPNPTVPVAPTNASPPSETSAWLQRMLDPKSPRNASGINDPRVTEIIAESYTILDEKELEESFQEMSALLRENAQSYIPTVWRYETVAYGKNLVGVQARKSGYPVLDGIGVAQD